MTSDITDFTPDMVNSSFVKPPPLLLATGIEANTPTSNLTIPLSYLPSDISCMTYEIFYFTEMSDITGSTTKYRQFNMTLNDNDNFHDIVPKYRNFTLKKRCWTSLKNETAYILVPENNSTLPPIISAMEIYTIHEDSDFDTTKEDQSKFFIVTIEKRITLSLYHFNLFMR